MDAPRRHAWIFAALLLGGVYFLIGRWFPQPANNLQAWRLGAWLVSGVAYAAHIAYEHFRLRNSPRVSALHVAAGVAIGAFGLAVAGMIHSQSAAGASVPRWLLALVLWPAITAVPGFLGALLAVTLLRFVSRSGSATGAS